MVHPTHLRVGHYLPGKLEQARPGVHLRPYTDAPARHSPQCWPVWGCHGCPCRVMSLQVCCQHWGNQGRETVAVGTHAPA